MFLTNGAKIFSAGMYVGAEPNQGGNGNSNLAVIAGGATWTNSSSARVGDLGAFNQLFITNGGVLRNTTSGGDLTMGFNTSGGNNVVVISGANSLFANNDVGGLSVIYVGHWGPQNQLLVADGGTAQTENLYVGYLPASSSNNVATIAGGNLIVTNAAGSGVTDVRSGTITLNCGSLVADSLRLTNGLQSQFTFIGGTLQTRSTSVTNGGTFIVGNGNIASPPATFQLLGNGFHSFAQGIDIMNNATLAGNGTINGMLAILGGGTLAPGLGGATPAFGKITLANSPLFQGTISMKLGKTGVLPANDQIQVNAPLFYGGWLVVSNIGPDPLALGDHFDLFSGSTLSGYFRAVYLPSLPSGLMWTNRLLVDGSIEVVPLTPPSISEVRQAGVNLMFNAAGGSPDGAYDLLTSTNIALPLAGWTTNSSGTFDWLGNANFSIPIDPALPEQFFRLQTHDP